MYRSLLILLLCSPVVHAEQSNAFRIDKPLVEILQSITLYDLDASNPAMQRTFPKAIGVMPDVEATMYARPTRRANGERQPYYRIDFHPVRPITATIEGRQITFTFTKRLEMWGFPDHSIFQSTVDLDVSVPRTCLPCINRIIDRVAGRLIVDAERRMLGIEERVITQLTNKEKP